MKIFISHAEPDQGFAKDLARRLIPWILERLRLVRIEDDPGAVGEPIVRRLKQMSTTSDPPPYGSATWRST